MSFIILKKAGVVSNLYVIVSTLISNFSTVNVKLAKSTYLADVYYQGILFFLNGILLHN